MLIVSEQTCMEVVSHADASTAVEMPCESIPIRPVSTMFSAVRRSLSSLIPQARRIASI
jgi:hypothetical protein